MIVFSVTDTGKTREINEDYFFVSQDPVGTLGNLLVIADGCGGHKAGEYASRRATECLVDAVRICPYLRPAEIFRYAIDRANKILYTEASRDSSLEKMATTAVLATVQDGVLWVANVGDSRLYVINEEIRQVTRDHCLGEELYRRGQISAEDVKKRGKDYQITRAIGPMEHVCADIFEHVLDKEDTVLLCTDGLTNMLPDELIYSVMKKKKPLRKRLEELVELANRQGGGDNITIIAAEALLNEVKPC